MSLLNSVIEFTYNPKYKMLFFISPFIIAGLCWVFIFLLLFLGVDKNFLPLLLAPGLIYFLVWLLIMNLRMNFYSKDGKTHEVEYHTYKEIVDRLANAAKELGFEVKVEEKMWALTTIYELKINGSLDGVSFRLEHAIDGPESGRGISYSTYVYIDTIKREGLVIRPKDLDLPLDSILDVIKKRILTNLKPELIWLMKENGFVNTINASHGPNFSSLGFICNNEYNLAGKLKETIEVLVKVAKEYEK